MFTYIKMHIIQNLKNELINGNGCKNIQLLSSEILGLMSINIIKYAFSSFKLRLRIDFRV